MLHHGNTHLPHEFHLLFSKPSAHHIIKHTKCSDIDTSGSSDRYACVETDVWSIGHVRIVAELLSLPQVRNDIERDRAGCNVSIWTRWREINRILAYRMCTILE